MFVRLTGLQSNALSLITGRSFWLELWPWFGSCTFISHLTPCSAPGCQELSSFAPPGCHDIPTSEPADHVSLVPTPGSGAFGPLSTASPALWETHHIGTASHVSSPFSYSPETYERFIFLNWHWVKGHCKNRLSVFAKTKVWDIFQRRLICEKEINILTILPGF